MTCVVDTPGTDVDVGTAAAVPTRSFGRDGVVAGAMSVLVFTWVHHLTISNIWPMLGVMLAAGAMCGLCLAWSYGRLTESYSIGTWLGYNAIYLAMFAALAVTSVVFLEPVTTMAAFQPEEARLMTSSAGPCP